MSFLVPLLPFWSVWSTHCSAIFFLSSIYTSSCFCNFIGKIYVVYLFIKTWATKVWWVVVQHFRVVDFFSSFFGCISTRLLAAIIQQEQVFPNIFRKTSRNCESLSMSVDWETKNTQQCKLIRVRKSVFQRDFPNEKWFPLAAK